MIKSINNSLRCLSAAPHAPSIVDASVHLPREVNSRTRHHQEGGAVEYRQLMAVRETRKARESYYHQRRRASDTRRDQ